MRCTDPRTVGFHSDGKSLAWSPRKISKQYATFQLPCGQCIACRLDYARQWAIRCIHEAQMYEKNSFVTLTYDDESLVSPKLIYKDFQLFMKKLRKTQNEPIGCFVTGEYGEKTKRPHWHAILFNYRPSDCTPKYKNHRGDQVFDSPNLSKIWGKGLCDVGSVTFESAGYVARYAAKKLVHGPDDSETFKPISKKSNKQAIGKKWLEKFWPDVFNYGEIILPDGNKSAIPRYYEKWLKIHHPERWIKYVTETKQRRIDHATSKNELQQLETHRINNNRARKGIGWKKVRTQNEAKKIIQQQKFNQLQKGLKL